MTYYGVLSMHAQLLEVQMVSAECFSMVSVRERSKRMLLCPLSAIDISRTFRIRCCISTNRIGSSANLLRTHIFVMGGTRTYEQVEVDLTVCVDMEARQLSAPTLEQSILNSRAPTDCIPQQNGDSSARHRWQRRTCERSPSSLASAVCVSVAYLCVCDG